MSKRPQTRKAKLRELQQASVWRLREESTIAEVVISIVGTGGHSGEVFVEWGQSNPAGVYGVLQTAMEQVEDLLGIGTEAEEEDAEDE